MIDREDKIARCIKAFERKYGREGRCKVSVDDELFPRQILIERGNKWAMFDTTAWRVRMIDWGVLDPPKLQSGSYSAPPPPPRE